MFQVMIGRDFERGLIRLEYMVKLGRVPAKLEYFLTSLKKVNGFKIAGLSAVCSMSILPIVCMVHLVNYMSLSVRLILYL